MKNYVIFFLLFIIIGFSDGKVHSQTTSNADTNGIVRKIPKNNNIDIIIPEVELGVNKSVRIEKNKKLKR